MDVYIGDKMLGNHVLSVTRLAIRRYEMKGWVLFCRFAFIGNQVSVENNQKVTVVIWESLRSWVSWRNVYRRFKYVNQWTEEKFQHLRKSIGMNREKLPKNVDFLQISYIWEFKNTETLNFKFWKIQKFWNLKISKY